MKNADGSWSDTLPRRWAKCPKHGKPLWHVVYYSAGLNTTKPHGTWACEHGRCNHMVEVVTKGKRTVVHLLED